MPCNGDYMNPNHDEINSRKVAQHIVYVQKKLGSQISPLAIKASNNYYGDSDNLNHFTQTLCGLLKSLSPEQIEKIVYNAKEKESRELATWWEEHQEADREREKKIAEAIRKRNLINSAKSKLTEEEYNAIKNL